MVLIHPMEIIGSSVTHGDLDMEKMDTLEVCCFFSTTKKQEKGEQEIEMN